MFLVYVTCSNAKEAERIGKSLVTSKLAACAHIFSEGKSFYWWHNTVQEHSECVLLLKIKDSNYARVEKKILAMHSDKVPCIFAIKPKKVFKKYAAWVKSGK